MSRDDRVEPRAREMPQKAHLLGSLHSHLLGTEPVCGIHVSELPERSDESESAFA